MKIRIAVAVSVIAILVAAVSYGQTSSTTAIGRVTIPFKYMVGKKEMPAGSYEFLKVPGKVSTLQLRGLDNKTYIFVAVIERLAETNPSEKHNTRVVFDTVGERKFLSELWPGGNADGYLLGINKGEQKHETVEEK